MTRDQQLRQLALCGGEATAVRLELLGVCARRAELLALDHDPSDLLGQRFDRRWRFHAGRLRRGFWRSSVASPTGMGDERNT